METFDSKNYCLILAGGKGKRLWPVSREAEPKQFLDFFSTGRTLLQQTFDRVAKFINKENILIATNADYIELVRRQLPEADEKNLLAEPVSRNTAPSVAWAICRIRHRCDKARLVVVPSDQMVMNEDAFRENVLNGLGWVGDNDHPLAMGVKPSRPEPGYGYIQIDSDMDSSTICRVKSFTEKPEREFAEMFMKSGEFLWNTGLFLGNVDCLKDRLAQQFPAVMRNVDCEGVDYSVEIEEECVEERYSVYPNLSIDYALLEKCDDVGVMKCDFGWADLGTWHSMYETMSKGQDDNVVLCRKVIMEKCSDNIVKLPDDHLAVLHGLDGYIVAEKGNVLLVCKKEDSSALVRKFINKVQMQEGEEFL